MAEYYGKYTYGEGAYKGVKNSITKGNNSLQLHLMCPIHAQDCKVLGNYVDSNGVSWLLYVDFQASPVHQDVRLS